MSDAKKVDDSTIQKSLDFSKVSEATSDADLDFVLKISEGHLHNLTIGSVSNLLSALGQIVGVKEATFKTIKEGSTTVAISVPPEYKAIATANVEKETSFKNRQILRIQKELKKYGWNSAQISNGTLKDGQPYNPKKILCSVLRTENEQTFKQNEVIDGRVTRLQKGKDKSDHITIISNDKDVSADCSTNLLNKLLPYFESETKLRFRGEATYSSRADEYEPTLKKYTIHNFEVIEDLALDDWIDEFRSNGSSDWLEYDDPIGEWLLRERQD